MPLLASLRREIRYISGLSRLLKRVRPVVLDSKDLACDDLEAAVDRFPDKIAIIHEDRQVTYRELDALANRFAHWAKGRGLRRGDTVAMVLPNRIEFIACWYGLNKVGVACALVNNNVVGPALAHSLSISAAATVIADAETWAQVEAARGLTDHAFTLWVLGLAPGDETSARRGLDTAVKGASAVRPDRSLRAGMTNRDTALYIYTSGTTGMPKAARIPHSRVRLYMRAFAGCTGTGPDDRLYCVLPLYHATGGLCGVGAALLNGAAIVLRQKFSASHFWPDVVSHRCTHFVYIGELCRYLVNQPPHELERAHGLKLVFGNGLRPDVWGEFKSRFAIPEILEFYGSTEGNVSLFNFDGRPGAIGRVPSYVRGRINVRLVAFDVEAEEAVRGANGLCREATVGEVGEAVGLIGNDARQDYSGYADRAASEKKILRDVFQRGDAWFRTGDLMRQDREGYFYFIDRIGDTFRWKGENVSTSEVAERLAGAPGVEEVIVYGVPVPGNEGKAGMAVLVLSGKFDAKAFADYVRQQLPAYAQPLFIRIRSKAGLETTGTFKYRKVDLVAEGFDPARTGEPVYVRDPKGAYVKMTPTRLAQLNAGETRL